MLNWGRQRVLVSDWKPVLGGVSQVSVVGPLLFLVYIYDLDNNVANHLLKFADDTKLFRNLGSYHNTGNLQDDSD